MLALGLSACGGGGSSGPDSSGQTTPTPAASATQGTLVDDVIVGGTVFCDGNGNRVQDADESVAVTDEAGNIATHARGKTVDSLVELVRLRLPAGRGVAA